MNLIKKKGAIELSMTTIIVIVIGVTLLILGLTWVRGMFEKVEGLTSESFRAAEKLIQEQMGSDDKMYIAGFDFDIEGGKSEVVYMGIQNFGTPGARNTFTVEIEPKDLAGIEFSEIRPVTMEVGGKEGIPFVITIERGIEPGKIFPFTISTLKDGQPYDSEQIIVRVK